MLYMYQPPPYIPLLIEESHFSNHTPLWDVFVSFTSKKDRSLKRFTYKLTYKANEFLNAKEFGNNLHANAVSPY